MLTPEIKNHQSRVASRQEETHLDMHHKTGSFFSFEDTDGTLAANKQTIPDSSIN
jgi:hypothetical protein